MGALITDAALPSAQQKVDRETKVRDDRKKLEASGYWHYNDLPAAFAEAKSTGKPIKKPGDTIPLTLLSNGQTINKSFVLP